LIKNKKPSLPEDDDSNQKAVHPQVYTHLPTATFSTHICINFINENAHNTLDSMMDPIVESAVLKPRDPSITSENDWPEFELANVEVKDKKGDHSNLLLASDAMPMTITGNLVLNKTQQQFRE